MIRTGFGFDAHRFAADRPLRLGGVDIPHAVGLAGHSDADVLCHALCDALLGSVAAGDIGVHFPDDDRRWKDASSVDLLRRVGAVVATEGARVLNVDVTVVAEQPKLAGHINAMRARLAEALAIDVRYVSIKATTVEGMGALGREEGMAAMAVATVVQEGSEL